MSESVGPLNSTIAVSGLTGRSVCGAQTLFAAQFLDRGVHTPTHTHTYKRSRNLKGHYFGAESLCD